MNKAYTTLLLWIPLLIIAQALVFNHVCILGYAVPFVFLYGLVRLPFTMSKEWQFTIGFIVGLVLDIFSDTLGMNALCCTMLMAFRRPAIRLYVPRDDEIMELMPGIKSCGFTLYLKYVLTCCLIYCTLFFTVETMGTFHLWRLCGKIIASTILTVGLILCIDSLTIAKREKRL